MKVTEVFKTIFARFGNIKAGKFVDDETGESLNDVAKVLSKFNIALYDAQGNMNDVGDILSIVASKWDKLTAVEQNAIATAVAGTRQRENFLVLMENYEKATEYSTLALESEGTAMEKFGAHTDSIEGKLNSLSAATEKWSQNLIDSGLVKGIIDMGTGLVTLADNLHLVQGAIYLLVGVGLLKLPKLLIATTTAIGQGINKFKNYSIALNAAANAQKLGGSRLAAYQNLLNTTGVSLANYNQKQLLNILTNLGLEESEEELNEEKIKTLLMTNGVEDALASETAAKFINITATKTQTASQLGLVSALKIQAIQLAKNIAAFAMAHPYITAITAALALATIGFIAYNKAIKENTERINENFEKAQENLQKTEEERKSIQDLTKEYEELRGKSSLDASEKQRVLEIEKQLNEHIKQINANIDKTISKEQTKLEYLNAQTQAYSTQKRILDQIDITSAKILSGDAKANLVATIEKINNDVAGKKVFGTNLSSEMTTAVGSYTSWESEFANSELRKILGKTFKEVILTNTSSARGYQTVNSEISYKFSKDADQMVKQLNTLREARQYYLDNYTAEQLINNDFYQQINEAIKNYSDTIIAYETASLKFWSADTTASVAEDLKNKDYIKDEKYEVIDSTEALEAYIAQKIEEAKVNNENKEISEEYKQSIRDTIENLFPQYVKKSKEVTDGTNYSTRAIEDLKKEIDSLSQTYEDVNSIVEDYNTNGSISYENLEKLLDLDVKYLAALVDENGQIKANTSALEALTKARIEEAYIAKIEEFAKAVSAATTKEEMEALLGAAEAQGVLTEARLQDVAALMALNPLVAEYQDQIWAVFEGINQLFSSIRVGGNNTSNAEKATEKYEKALAYVNKTIEDQIELLEKEKEAVEKEIEEKIKAKEKEIELLEKEKEALEDKNEEKDKEIELQELQMKLQKAQQRTMRVYYADKGWVWEQNPEEVQKAQQELDDFYTEQEIDNIDKKIEALEEEVEALERTTDEEDDLYDKRLKQFDKQIKKLEDYKQKWNEVKENYEHQQNELIAQQMFGADAEAKILDGRVEILEDFKTGYTNALGEAASKTQSYCQDMVMDLSKVLDLLKQINAYTGDKAVSEFEEEGITSENRVYDARSRETIIKTGASGDKYIKIGEGKWVNLEDTTSEGSYYHIKEGVPIYFNPYASGTKSASKGWANVDEKGKELIIPKQGRYRMMEYGDIVLPNNLSNKMFEVATNPLKFITNALNSTKIPILNGASSESNSTIISIGTIELPQVTNGENFIKQLKIIAANR